jgi:hypothetical protein
LQELGTGLVAAAFAAGEFGFGRDEAAFDGGFEDGSLVTLEVGLDALQVRDGFVEAGELLFDFGDDSLLLAGRRNNDFKRVVVVTAESGNRSRTIKRRKIQRVEQILVIVKVMARGGFNIIDRIDWPAWDRRVVNGTNISFAPNNERRPGCKRCGMHAHATAGAKDGVSSTGIARPFWQTLTVLDR